MEKPLTRLEKKLLDEVIRPALSEEFPDHFMGHVTVGQRLNFGKLLTFVRDFYNKNVR